MEKVTAYSYTAFNAENSHLLYLMQAEELAILGP